MYFLSSPHGFCGLSLGTCCFFLAHSMVFFWNRFEVPAVLRGRINVDRPRYYVPGGGIGGDWGSYDLDEAGAGTGNPGGRPGQSNTSIRGLGGVEGRASDDQIGMSLSGPNSRAPSPSFALFQGVSASQSEESRATDGGAEVAGAARGAGGEPPLLGSIVFSLASSASHASGESLRRRRSANPIL